MEYSKFKGKFVLINDKFEINYDEKVRKPYITVGWRGCKIYFNILEEEEENFYAIFEDCDIEKAMLKDDNVDFDFKHNKDNYSDWECDFEKVFKYEERNKKLIVFNQCDKCNEIINENDDFFICNDCGDVGCDICYFSTWNDCDQCETSYCSDCDWLDYSEILDKSYCDDCEPEIKEEEERIFEEEEEEIFEEESEEEL